MTNKIFTFKYNPEITPEGMFASFWKAAKGKLHLVRPNEISSPHLAAILTSISKNQWEVFDMLVKKKPSSLKELAKLLGKNYDNIVKDTEVLESMGIIKLEKKNSEVKPVVLYDHIVFDFGCQPKPLPGDLKLEAEEVRNLLECKGENFFLPFASRGHSDFPSLEKKKFTS